MCIGVLNLYWISGIECNNHCQSKDHFDVSKHTVCMHYKRLLSDSSPLKMNRSPASLLVIKCILRKILLVIPIFPPILHQLIQPISCFARPD